MATELLDMEIGEISLVDDGANPGAKVVIVKAKFSPCADCKDSAMCKKNGKCASEPVAKGMTGFDLKIAQSQLFDNFWRLTDALRDSIRESFDGESPSEDVGKNIDAFVAKLKALVPDATAVSKALGNKEINVDLEELKKALGDAEAKLTELSKAMEGQTAVIKAKDDEIAALKTDVNKAKNPGAADEEFLKSLPEAARTEIVKLRQATADAAAQIAKANEQRETDQAIAKAKTFGVGKPEDLGPLLMRVAKGKTTEADAAALEQVLKSAGEVSSKSPLFKSAGSAAAVDGDPDEILKSKAAEIKKAKPGLSDAQAYTEALEANPALYEASLAKKRG